MEDAFPARVCRSWAAVALDALWRDPPPAALSTVPIDRRPLYAASVRSPSIFTAEQAKTPVHEGWVFPRLRWLVLPCEAIERAPDACRAFVARCGVDPPALRCVCFTEHPWGQGKARHFDGRYDGCLEGVLADLAQRRGLEEIIIDTAVTEKLGHTIIPSDGDSMAPGISAITVTGASTDAGYYAINTRELNDGARLSGSPGGGVISAQAAFRDLRRMHAYAVASGGGDVVLPHLLLLQPELLGSVTQLQLRLDFATPMVGGALKLISRLSALRLLSIGLPSSCNVSISDFVALQRLASLRHLTLGGAQYGVGIEHFPDVKWAQLVTGLRRLQTLEVMPWIGLSPRAVRILGTECRQLTKLVMIRHDEDIETWPLHHALPAAVATTMDSSGCDLTVLFPVLQSLYLHSTGRESDGAVRTLWSEGFVASHASGYGGPTDLSEKIAMQALASSLAMRLRTNAPKLEEFNYLDKSALERALEQNLVAAGIRFYRMEFLRKDTLTFANKYWDAINSVPKRHGDN